MLSNIAIRALDIVPVGGGDGRTGPYKWQSTKAQDNMLQ